MISTWNAWLRTYLPVLFVLAEVRERSSVDLNDGLIAVSNEIKHLFSSYQQIATLHVAVFFPFIVRVWNPGPIFAFAKPPWATVSPTAPLRAA